MLIKQDFEAPNPYQQTMWVSIGDGPVGEAALPSEADYAPITGVQTLDVSIEPKPNEEIKRAFAERIGPLVGADTITVEWVMKEVPGRRPPERPVAQLTFGDERGWDKERVFAVLNATQILGRETLAWLY